MKKLVRLILTMAGVVSVACGPSNGGTTTAPTAPAQSLPPSVNVNGTGTSNGQPVHVIWDGAVSWNEQTGTNTMTLDLTQTGTEVTGTLHLYGPDGGGGPFRGTLSGNAIAFNFSVGNNDQGCGNTGSGNATVGTNTITGSFSGKRCNGTTYTNGKFTLTLPVGFHTSAYPVAGTWAAAFTNAALGRGQWTVNIAETGVDLNGSTVSGSVTVSGGTLALGSGSLTGSVTNTFPGPTTTARMMISFSGTCASMLVYTAGFSGVIPAFDTSMLGGGITGTTCNGAVPQGIGLPLTKQ